MAVKWKTIELRQSKAIATQPFIQSDSISYATFDLSEYVDVESGVVGLVIKR